MTDTSKKVERLNQRHQIGMVPDTEGKWVRASDYDALAAKLIEVKAELQSDREAQWVVLDSVWKRRAEAAEAKLAEVEAERDEWHKECMAQNKALFDANDRAEAAIPTADAQNPLDDPKVKALVDAVEKTLNPEGTSIVYRRLVKQNLRIALAALKENP